jgi:rhodanese-related sulfurtransferase
MTKHKQAASSRQAHNRRRNRNLWFVAGAIALALVAFGVAFLRSGTSAQQPVAMAQIADITPTDYQSQFISTGKPHLLVDVRTTEEFASGHIAGSVNIVLDTIEARLNDIPRDRPVVLYCRSGNRSAQAATLLAKAGYTNILDLGGINEWVAQGYPVE